jgi:hypothetical protein
MYLLPFQPFHLKDHRFDTISATGDKVVFIFHPGAKVAICHQDHDNLMNIVPGPIAFEVIWTFSQIVHGEFISHLDERARAFGDIWTAIFFDQVLVVQRFQNGNFAGGERVHLYLLLLLEIQVFNG